MPINTVAIVTGASKGLGLALAQGLIASDTHLITLSRTKNETLTAQATAAGCSLQQIAVDLSDIDEFEKYARPAIAGIPLTAKNYFLFNNAGIVEPIGLAPTLDDLATINHAYAVNVSSVISLTAVFLQATATLTANRRILNISSGAGRKPMPGWGVYCATKAALDMYTQVLQSENHNIRVASMAPGVLDTGMQNTIRHSDVGDFPAVEHFMQLHQTGQLATPAAIAHALLTFINSVEFGTTVLDDIRRYI